MASTSQPTTIGEGEERNEEDAAAEATGNGIIQAVMPEDGYEWKKYGQKFIKNIQKIRSYFRCRHKLCGAKKRVEWHPHDPSSDRRIVYEGAHQHGSPSEATGVQGDGGGAPNQYELSTQYFGGARSQ
ncbi:WRKY transcription factor 71-like [Phragmites australis]|uniref:WRKY transcription factor 71-like n=1 Tax=Phragmites australis TaxID=29695 RepID=UPI002D7750F0|nr:WRKY transcription factor 71-like [Phragmites australis]